MRNDDENPGRVHEPSGKILYSGIGTPDPEDLEPAEYALAEGVPALMDEVPSPAQQPDDAEALAPPRLFRTPHLCAAMLLGCFVGGALMPIGDALFGRQRNTADPLGMRPTRDREIWLAGARHLAKGDLAELIRSHDAFMRIIELHGADQQLWNGVNRLATFAVVNKGKDDQAPRIASRILQAFDFRPPPSSLRTMIPELQAVAD